MHKDTKLDEYKKEQIEDVKDRKVSRDALDMEINRRVTELFEKVIIMETTQRVMNSDLKAIIETSKATLNSRNYLAWVIITQGLIGLALGVIATYFTFFN